MERMGLRILMAMSLAILLGISFASTRVFAIADGVLCTQSDPCKAKGILTKRSPGPTKSDSVRLNPAEVPFDTVTGIETLYYGGTFDFAFVKGLGRVGAAISPSNNQETFFGAPAIEASVDYLNRMDARQKYDAQKYSLAGGVSLISSNGSGLKHIDVSLGAIAKYNKATGHVKPGAGLLAVAGPIWIGASKYQDEDTIAGTDPLLVYNTDVTVLSGGVALESLAVDYSVLKVDSDAIPATASVLTASIFFRRAILTAARREVVSDKPRYDFDLPGLVIDRSKVEYFGGVQYRVAPFLVVGAFYNYYLLHEISFGATVFF